MLKDEISINRNKYFVSPSGKITYAMIGDSHPKLAERIVNQNPKLKKIYDVEKDKNEGNFLIYYGYILVDVTPDESEVVYCSFSLKENQESLERLTNCWKYDVYEEEIKGKKEKQDRLDEILRARELNEKEGESQTKDEKDVKQNSL